MTDKSKELTTSLSLINNKLHFTGKTGENQPVSIDYISPLGDDLGYTSLELLLLSLSSCVGSAVLTFLRKMTRTITSCEIKADGIRRQEHPTGFSQITLFIEIGSPDATIEDVIKVIKLAEDKYCPVYSMIRGNCEVKMIHRLTRQ